MSGTSWLMPDVPRADIAGQIGSLAGAKEHDDWTDGEVSIPKGNTTRRREYDKDYLARLVRSFGGPHFQLTSACLDARTLFMTNQAVNRERYDMYKRMMRAGDSVPPIIVEARTLNVLDGNHRTQAALDTKRFVLPALLRTPVARGESAVVPKRMKKCPRRKKS